MLKRKRSSCASGSGYVPSCSIGFCVASTKNGRGSGIVCPAAVTCRSCIASSSAACVRGGVRLISSARTMFAKIGPFTNRKRRAPVAASSSRISVPVMSLGTRSGVNWIRRNSSAIASAIERIMSVLARPGTPTSSAWPPASIAMRTSSTTCSWPMIRFPTSARSCLATARSASASARPVTPADATIVFDAILSPIRASPPPHHHDHAALYRRAVAPYRVIVRQEQQLADLDGWDVPQLLRIPQALVIHVNRDLGAGLRVPPQPRPPQPRDQLVGVRQVRRLDFRPRQAAPIRSLRRGPTSGGGTTPRPRGAGPRNGSGRNHQQRDDDVQSPQVHLHEMPRTAGPASG